MDLIVFVKALKIFACIVGAAHGFIYATAVFALQDDTDSTFNVAWRVALGLSAAVIFLALGVSIQ